MSVISLSKILVMSGSTSVWGSSINSPGSNGFPKILKIFGSTKPSSSFPSAAADDFAANENFQAELLDHLEDYYWHLDFDHSGMLWSRSYQSSRYLPR